MNELTADELRKLFLTVFKPRETDHVLTILVDVPNQTTPDNEEWVSRRKMAYDWWVKAIGFKADLGLDRVEIFYYENVESNNNDLPEMLYHLGGSPASLNTATLLKEGMPIPLADVLASTDLIIAPTEFSATAPCKILAKQYNFRGTTMPGFIPAMIPALSLDYEKVHDRIMDLKKRLDVAHKETIIFSARGKDYSLECDLRYRKATASSGMFHDDMVVGNLPSGETYIVPYEGERDYELSKTSGELPVQFGNEIVVYRIEANRAVEVLSTGPTSDSERAKLIEEPAYGNIAEIGHGILGDFGCTAVGNLLMDEKLGLHVAFGRSEHFGGITSPKSFHNPKKVVHIDRVYVKSLQPDIMVKEVFLFYQNDLREMIMFENLWVV